MVAASNDSTVRVGTAAACRCLAYMHPCMRSGMGRPEGEKDAVRHGTASLAVTRDTRKCVRGLAGELVRATKPDD